MEKKVLFGILFLCLIVTVAANKPSEEIPKENKEAGIVKSAEINKKEDYKKLYSLSDNFIKANPSSFDVSARSAIVVDVENGEILYQKNDQERMPPASITKILTASIALENLDLNKKLSVSKRAADTEPNKIVMKEGEKMRVEDLMYALFMISANDAAEVLTEGIDGKRETFIKKMKEKVRLLDLKNTDFENPSGLDQENHYSSTYDIAKITLYALRTHPEIINYAGRTEDYSVYQTTDNESHWWGNISSALGAYPELLAVKTGYTQEAGNTFVGIGNSNGKKFIYVFMGSNSGAQDAKNLLYYGIERMRVENP